MDYRSFLTELRGPIVPLMAPFDEKKCLDLTSLQKWVNWLIEQGIRLMWTTHGSSHYMCLMDKEIWDLNHAASEVAHGKAFFIASTSYHWSTRECIQFIHDCAEWGAAAVKVQVDWRWVQEEKIVREYYREIAAESPLPLLAYTLAVPSYSSGMSHDLLKSIIDIPQFVGLKNDSGDFYEEVGYLRVIEQQGKPFTSITGGTMESFLHAYDFGAQAFATGIGVFAPHLPMQFYRLLCSHERSKAVNIVKKYELPLNDLFRRTGKGNSRHWACFQTILMKKHLLRSNTMREVLRTHASDEEESVLTFVQQMGLL